MKILGINISHDSSIACVEDGNPVFCHDESRFKREKYWSPGDSDNLFECIERQVDVDEYDDFIFATFDRRVVDYEVNKEKLAWDKLKSREFLKDVRAQQLSQTRIDELQKKYGRDFKAIRRHRTTETLQGILQRINWVIRPHKSF